MRCGNILLRAVAASFKARVGHSSGVSTKLYRFSRSRRVLLYESIGRKDQRHTVIELPKKIRLPVDIVGSQLL